METNKKRIIAICALLILLIIIILICVFREQKYRVTFDSNGGSEVNYIVVKEDDKIQRPEDPKRNGYIFTGWYYNSELYNFDTPVKQNIILKAEWTPAGEAEVEGVKLNSSELSLAVNETATLEVELLPENAKPTKLKWTSSDENILTVDENGKIKALKEGKATVTVATEDEEYKASCEVTVTAATASPTPSTQPSTKPSTKPSQAPTQPSQAPSTGSSQTQTTVSVTGVTLTGASQVDVGKNITLTASVQPSNATNKNVTWSSSNPSVASVNNGVVTGISEGETTITVTTEDGSYTATHTVTVKSVYTITFTANRDEEAGDLETIFDYTVTVKKDGQIFNGYSTITYNNRTAPFKQNVAKGYINTSIHTALITIGGKTVNATVYYN